MSMPTDMSLQRQYNKLHVDKHWLNQVADGTPYYHSQAAAAADDINLILHFHYWWQVDRKLPPSQK